MVIAVRHALTYRFKLRHSCAFHRLTERPFHMNFASDNTAPVAPAILDAIVEASRGYARGYGNDDWTQAVERRLSEVFEREVAVFLVPTGTAANALSLAQVTPPWGIVLCLAESHIVTDECGAPDGGKVQAANGRGKRHEGCLQE